MVARPGETRAFLAATARWVTADHSPVCAVVLVAWHEVLSQSEVLSGPRGIVGREMCWVAPPIHPVHVYDLGPALSKLITEEVLGGLHIIGATASVNIETRTHRAERRENSDALVEAAALGADRPDPPDAEAVVKERLL